LGNCHPELDDNNPGMDNDRQGEEPVPDINMVFMIPIEFRAPTEDVTELALRVERAMFEKLEIQVRT
jgi:hypothetical protein